ncbi:hypothetical protein ATN38_26625 [Rhodococcus sp. FH8]|jgi:hypothetical protein|uniref:hypothetical protein n=1 Tax=Rhodococcus sp. FH8 TaxID=1761013 RepID=UPI001C4FD781|nr:hypothetical protein [Rhodococcus sp. FH8]MBW0283298.1 hypothetical protein [Rhodococcus sp. FH8]
MSIPVAFVAASVIEAVAIHFLVPWQWLRVMLLVATVLSLIAIGGWLAGRVVHPHLVSARTVVFRCGTGVRVEVDRSRISRVSMVRRFGETANAIVDDCLVLPGPDGTAVDVGFDRPVSVTLPKRLSKATPTTIGGLRLHVDQPGEFCAALSRD